VPRMRGDTREGMQGTPVVLKVENLRKVYRSGGGFLSKERRVVAVNDVSFELRKGRTLGIVGESGSGKSSLGKLLMKLIDCDGGRIILNGEDVAAMPEAGFPPLSQDHPDGVSGSLRLAQPAPHHRAHPDGGAGDLWRNAGRRPCGRAALSRHGWPVGIGLRPLSARIFRSVSASGSGSRAR
jgi:ABC-type oligopeptide transport system, ATPase component